MAFMAHHKPSKVAQLGRRIFAVDEKDDRTAAIETVAHLRAFFTTVLRMPATFKDLGIEKPDIATMVEHLHANKGESIGGYYRLTAKDTCQIYELMLDESQRSEQMSSPEPQPVQSAG